MCWTAGSRSWRMRRTPWRASRRNPGPSRSGSKPPTTWPASNGLPGCARRNTRTRGGSSCSSSTRRSRISETRSSGSARGQCPTCLRPLGVEHRAVLDVLNNQLDVIVTDGTYFKQRIEQLAMPPAAVTEAEAARDALREEARQVTEREGNLRAQASERARAQKERAGLAKRMQEIERRVAARDAGYDAER